MKKQILLVEPIDEMAHSILSALKKAGFEVIHHRSARTALLDSCCSLVMISSTLHDMGVIDWIQAYRRLNAKSTIIGLVEHYESHLAADMMQASATDYLLRPFDNNQLLSLLARVESIEQPMLNIIAESCRSKQLLQLAQRAARTNVSVLITGETGTGKEVLARYLHLHSSRRDNPYVAVNCAAIPESMLEAVLFGHVKGAFTGALQSQSGKFEQANNGSIFLDEIAEMSPMLQAKLLRVLQEREVERLGSHSTLKLDIRIIAATNKNLREEVKQGRFREDLFYRLYVLPLHLHPLRERTEDILPLAHHFIKKYQESGFCQLSSDAISSMSRYDWPGNIRELENVIQRALVLRHGEYITAQDLMLPVSFDAPANNTPLTEKQGHVEVKKQAEFQYIFDLLVKFNGNRTKTAESLGVSTRALRYKLAAMRQQGFDIQSLLNSAA